MNHANFRGLYEARLSCIDEHDQPDSQQHSSNLISICSTYGLLLRMPLLPSPVVKNESEARHRQSTLPLHFLSCSSMLNIAARATSFAWLSQYTKACKNLLRTIELETHSMHASALIRTGKSVTLTSDDSLRFENEDCEV